MSEELSWFVLQGGQQCGPYTGAQLAGYCADGTVAPESLVWAQGMAEWLPASQIEGLVFPQPEAPVAAPPPAAQRVVGGRPPWMTGASTAPAAVEGGYPPLHIKPASFGLIVGALAVGFVLLLVAAFGSTRLSGDGSDGGLGMLLAVVAVVGVAALLFAGILQLSYLFRAWRCLVHANPRTTPGMAVGLLFVPLFNLYWVFQAYHGFAVDWNRESRRFADLQLAPRLSEGLFLTFCIGSVAFAPLGLVLWFPVMAGICKVINFMAYRPQKQPGMLTFG